MSVNPDDSDAKKRLEILKLKDLNMKIIFFKASPIRIHQVVYDHLLKFNLFVDFPSFVLQHVVQKYTEAF